MGDIITVIMEKFDLTVAGSGPGGYIAAMRVAQMGMKIAVVERDKPECYSSKFNGRCETRNIFADSTSYLT